MKRSQVKTRPLTVRRSALVRLGLVVLCAAQLRAQPVETQPLPPSRYLLIVDTSRAMDARSRNTLKTVEDLLKSDMSGQIKAGDTLGLWTFNAGLYAGRFPLQRWSPNERKAITDRVLDFLKHQKYEKAADLESVLAAMERVVKDSPLITVVLVSAGDGAIHGTSFDDRINDFWQRWREKQKSARMPFVLVLRARSGGVMDYSLNRPPSPVQMPYLPVEPQLASPAPRKSPEAPRATQPPAVAPLIISGKKPKPLQAPKSEETAPGKPEAPPLVAPGMTGNTDAPASAPAGPQEAKTVKVEPAPAPTTTSKPAESVKAEQARLSASGTESTTPANMPVLPVAPSPKPVQAATTVQSPAPPEPVAPAAAPAAPVTPAVKEQAAQAPMPVPSPSLVQSAAAAPKAESVKPPEPKPATAATVQPAAPVPPPAAKVETARVPEAKAVASQPLQLAATPPQSPAPKPSTGAVEPSKPAPATAVTALPVTPAPAPVAQAVAALPSPSVRPPLASSPPPTQNLVAAVANAPPVPAKPVPPAPLPSPSREASAGPATPQPGAAQATVAVPPGTLLSQKAAWIAGIVLAAAALGFGLLALRRSRATSDASLITRSLDRERRR